VIEGQKREGIEYRTILSIISGASTYEGHVAGKAVDGIKIKKHDKRHRTSLLLQTQAIGARIGAKSKEIIMQTTFKLFFSCLFCFSLILLNGCEYNVRKDKDFVSTTEIPIGDKNTFKLSDSRGDSIESFSLVMHVSVLKADERKFQRRYEASKNKVIDRVITALRLSTTEERREPGNMAIKKNVKTAINDVLETPWVQEVFFAEITHEIK